MKAILVIDMPNNCEECNIIYFQGHGERSTCDSGDWSKRPSWCPLRPLPKKKAPHFDPNDSTYDEERERSIMNEIDGYNRCIDEITGEV